jgi:hypothetical protein
MVTSLTRWPPVGGHPAMEVTIEMQFSRSGEGGTREVGVRGARLLFALLALLLTFLVFLV